MVQLFHWVYIVGSFLVTGAGTLLVYLRRRWAKSAGREIQPFRSYVVGSIRLAVVRRLRPPLARLFGVRAYADVTYAGFTQRMPIPSRGRSSLDIERAYIRLSLSSSPERRVDDEALLDTEGSVLIFGEPGSGKSSLTRKLHRQALKRASARPMTSRLPVHLELGRLPWDRMPAEPEAAVAWLLDLLRAPVRRVTKVNQPDYVFDAFAHGPGLMISLDGLDEVPPDKIKAAGELLSAAIEALLHETTKTLVIVTARTQMRDVMSRSFVAGFGEVLTVTPFTPADVFAFLRRWDFPADRRLIDVQRIFEHLRNNVTLSEMCTNPLVLAMYVAEDELQTKSAGSAVRLADTRAKFYDQVVGEFLYFRREDQRIDDQHAGTQLLVTRQELLGRIALDHLLNSTDSANVVSLARAAKVAQKYWKIDPDQVAARLEVLAVDTGLVTVQVQGKSLQFIHLSIAEYLAGRELAERNEKQLRDVLAQVAGREAQDRRLWELAIFAVALSKRDRREEALRDLAKSDAPGELSLRILRELQTYDLPEFHRALDDATRQIFARTVQEWDEEWLAQVRLVASCLGDAERLAAVRRQGGVPTMAAWLSGLVAGDTERLDHIFGLYLATSPAEALRVAGQLGLEAALLTDRERIVATMEHPDVVALAMRMAADAGDGSNQWIALLAEAALRHELVAQMLIEEPEPAGLAKLADGVDRQFAWHRFGLATGTYYGAVLALATAAVRPVKDRGAVRLVGQLDLVAKVRAGGRRWAVDRRLLVDIPILALAVVALTAILNGPSNSMGIPLLSVLPSILIAAYFVSLLLIRMVRDDLFEPWLEVSLSELLNVEAHPTLGENPLEVLVTRFDDGLVRIYVDQSIREAANDLPLTWIRRTAVAGSSLCDARGFALRSAAGYRLVNLVDSPPLLQAAIVSRRPGPKWCSAVDVRRSFTVVLPARRSVRKT